MAAVYEFLELLVSLALNKLTLSGVWRKLLTQFLPACLLTYLCIYIFLSLLVLSVIIKKKKQIIKTACEPVVPQEFAVKKLMIGYYRNLQALVRNKYYTRSSNTHYNVGQNTQLFVNKSLHTICRNQIIFGYTSLDPVENMDKELALQIIRLMLGQRYENVLRFSEYDGECDCGDVSSNPRDGRLQLASSCRNQFIDEGIKELAKYFYPSEQHTMGFVGIVVGYVEECITRHFMTKWTRKAYWDDFNEVFQVQPFDMDMFILYGKYFPHMSYSEFVQQRYSTEYILYTPNGKMYLDNDDVYRFRHIDADYIFTKGPFCTADFIAYDNRWNSRSIDSVFEMDLNAEAPYDSDISLISEDYEDQMHRSKYTIDQLELINAMVEDEKDRTLCKKILLKADIQDTDVLCVKIPAVKKFVENCSNYGVKLTCTIVGNDDRAEVIKQVAQLTIKESKIPNVDDYIIQDWVKIDKFLLMLNKLNKGQQHKLCKQLVYKLNDKWLSTFYHNNNSNCRALIKKLQYLNIESAIKTMSKFEKKLKYFHRVLADDKTTKQFLSNYEEQMFSLYHDFKNAMQGTSAAMDNFNTTYPQFMNKANQIADKCDLITNRMLALMENFNDSVSTTSVFLSLMKFVSFSYLISQQSNRTPSNIAALIALILPTSVGNSTIMSSLSRAVLGIIRNYDVATTEQGFSDQDSYSIAGALFNVMKNIVKSSFTTIDTKAYDDMRANTAFLKTISVFLRSCTNIVDFFIKAITTIMEFIMSCIMQYYGCLPTFLKDSQFESIIDKFLEIKKTDAMQDCNEDLICARKVIALKQEIDEIEASINKAYLKDKTLVYKVAPYVRLMASQLDKAYDTIPPHFKEDRTSHRVKPFFVFISGPPRIGKSKIFQPIVVNEIALKLGLIKEYQDPQHYCCFRVAGREFWDGGQGKKVIWYNDVFQGIANEQALDLAIEELASVVDDNPYHMNMSDVKDKGRFYLTAPVVVCNAQEDTTNCNWLNMRMWSQGEHLCRRRDINCVLQINNKYKKFDGTMNHATINDVVEKTPNLAYGHPPMFPNDLYVVTFRDVKTGADMFHLDFANAVKYIADKAKEYYSAQDMLTTRLILNMQNRWKDQMFSSDPVDEYLRPARRPPLQYNQTAKSRKQLFDEQATERDKQRLDELRHRNQDLLRPRRATIEIETTTSDGEVYYEVQEDIYPEDTDRIYDGSQTGSIYTHTLSSIACQTIATTLSSLLTTKVALPLFDYVNLSVPPGSIYRLLFKNKRNALAVITGITAELALAGIKVSGYYITHCGIFFMVLPYVAFIVQALFARGIHRTFKTIEDIIVFGFQNPQYYYENFIDYVYNTRDNILEAVFQCKDLIISSYYYALELYEKLNAGDCKHYFVETYNNVRDFATQFKNNAMNAFHQSYNAFKEKMNSIPGWTYFAAGVTIFGATGYLLYRYFKEDKPQEQSHEGNAKAKRRRIARKLGKKQHKPQVSEQAYDTTNREIENIIRNNYCYIAMEVKVNDTWVTTPLQGMALNLKSNIFVMPHHYWYRFEYCHNLYVQHQLENRLVVSWNRKESSSVYFDSLEVCALDYGHTADLTYFRIKKFCCGRDISHFFVSENDTPVLHNTYLFGYRPRGTPDFKNTEILNLGAVTTISKEYSTNPSKDVILGIDIPSEIISYDYCYHYTDCLTGPGDCTMVLMHTDSKVPRKIMGIHTAGNRSYQTGLAAPIYQEDIEEVVEFFNQTEPVITLQIDNKHVDYSNDLDPAAAPYIEHGFNVIANTGYINVRNKLRRITSSLPSVNKVQPSIVFERMEEDFGPTTLAPSALRCGKDKEGNVISPFKKAFNKLLHYTHNIPHKMHQDIVEHCAQSIKSWPSQWNKANARLLTWDECINGYMNLKGLDLSTASGFPYNMYCAGKKPWFTKQEDRYVMGDELMHDVLDMEEQLKKGLIPPIYFIDTLKDETRPIEKVEAYKTRLFQVGSMAWTILFRKYFGWFMGHCQSTYEFGEMMSGINPCSYDWNMLAKRMLAYSRLNDNGDYSDYDSTLGHQACTGMSDAANIFYADGDDPDIETSNLVRHGLILGSINRYHIVDKFIIYLKQGNPSGFLLTTIINNFCNMYYNRYAFVKLTGMSLSEFRKYVFCIFFGDDKNNTIHPDIQHLFTMPAYKRVIEELGLTYTSATKANIVQDLIPIEDIVFLKRKFVYDKDMQIWKSQLDKTVIMEIARWSESDPSNVDDQMNRFNSCLKELANYGEKEFQYVRNYFLKYIHELNMRGYTFKFEQLFTYHYSMYLMYPDHVTTRVPCYELALFGQQQDGVLHDKAGERELQKILTYTHDNYDENVVEEQSFIAQNTTFTLTKAEILVIKKRIIKTIVDNSNTFLPILTRTTDEITKAVLKMCPCPASDQVYDLVKNMISTGEIWQYVYQPITQQPIDMEPQGMDDEGPQKNVEEKQTTTTFLDVNEMHIARPLPNHIISGHQVQDTVTLDEFLFRPYLVQQLTWTSSNALYSSVAQIEFPYALTSIPAISSKLQNIAYWSPDIEITIRANATIFHYGALAFNWLPQAGALNAEYKTHAACMNSKNWVQLLCNARQPLRFIVPYTHYKNKITLGQETVGSANVREDLFTLYGYVSWPLSSAQSSVVAPVNVSIFARFVNPRVNGYKIDAFTPQGYDDLSWNNPPVLIDDDEVAEIERRGPPQDMTEINERVRNNLDLPPTHSSRVKVPQVITEKTDLVDLAKVRAAIKPRQYETHYARPQFRLHHDTPIERQILNRKRRPRYSPQGGDGEAQSVTRDGLISSTLLKIGDFVGKFVPIPFIGEIASPVSAITATAGYFAKWMGFSVTPSLETAMPMQVRQPYLQKTEDTTLAIPLCQNTGLVAKDFAYVNSYPNEMSISEFVGTPGLIYTGKVSPTNVPGDILFRRAISPDEFIYGDYNTPMPYTSVANGFYYAVPTYTKMASMFAVGWRGSFKIDINFFSTQFHSCRIVAVYQLYTNGTPTAPTTSNYTNAINFTMDLQSSTNFSFIIPFDQTVEYLNLNNDLRSMPTTKTLTENNGYITFMVLNELSSVISTPTDIGFQVFITPCSDFQLIGTRRATMGNSARGVFYPQGLDDSEACDYPASSVRCLMETKPIMMSTTDRGYRVSSIHHPYEITSLRQLMNQSSLFVSGTFPLSGNFTYSPYGVNPNLWTGMYDYLTIIQNFFRYSRGSVRYTALTLDTTATGYATSDLIDAPINQAIFPTNFYTATEPLNQGMGSYITNLLSRSPLDVLLPWYSIYKCHPNACATSYTTSSTLITKMPVKKTPMIYMNMQGTAGKTFYIYQSAGDDFLCGWTLPPMRIRYQGPATPSTDPMPKLARPTVLPIIKEESKEQDNKNETDNKADSAASSKPETTTTNNEIPIQKQDSPKRVAADSAPQPFRGFGGLGGGLNRQSGPPPTFSTRAKREANSDIDTEEEVEQLLNATTY